MKIIDDIKYYSSSEVAELVGRTRQTINRWDTFSQVLEERGEDRLIPKPIRLPGNRRYWKQVDIKEIKDFADNVSWGIMAEYNRTLWS